MRAHQFCERSSSALPLLGAARLQALWAVVAIAESVTTFPRRVRAPRLPGARPGSAALYVRPTKASRGPKDTVWLGKRLERVIAAVVKPFCAECGAPVDLDLPYQLWMAGLTVSGEDEYLHFGCAAVHSGNSQGGEMCVMDCWPARFALLRDVALNAKGVGNTDSSAMTELSNARLAECQGLRYVFTGPYRAFPRLAFPGDVAMTSSFWASVEALLNLGEAPSTRRAPRLEAVCQRSLQLAPLAAGLRQLADSGSRSVTMANVPRSYRCWHIDRLVTSGQRTHEFVLFELLGRFWRSHAGRRACSR